MIVTSSRDPAVEAVKLGVWAGAADAIGDKVGRELKVERSLANSETHDGSDGDAMTVVGIGCVDVSSGDAVVVNGEVVTATGTTLVCGQASPTPLLS